MKKIIYILFICIIPNLGFGQTLLNTVKQTVESRLTIITNTWETARYIPNSFKITDVDESNPKKLVINGTIDYKSDNCGAVNTTIVVTIKKILDSIEVTETCINIPYCAYKVEYSRERKCW